MTAGVGLFAGWHTARNQWRHALRQPALLVGTLVVCGLGVARLVSARPTDEVSGASDSLKLSLLRIVLVCLLFGALNARTAAAALLPGERQWLAASGVSFREVLIFRGFRSLWSAAFASLVVATTLASGVNALLVARLAGGCLFFLLLRVLEVNTGLAGRMPERPARDALVFAGARVLVVLAVLAEGVHSVALIAQRWVHRTSGEIATSPAGNGMLEWFIGASQWWSLPTRLFTASLTGATVQHSLVGILLVVVAGVVVLHRAHRYDDQWAFIDSRSSSNPNHSHRSRSAGVRWFRTVVMAIASRVAPSAAPLAWKNATAVEATQRSLPLMLAWAPIPLLLVVETLPPLKHLTSFALGLVSTFGVLLVAAGPLFVRADLRASLPKLALIRALPFRTVDLLLAENIPSAVFLTIAQTLFLGMLVAAVQAMGVGDIARPWLVLLPAYLLVFNGANVAVHCVLAAVFPSLTRVGPWAPASRAEVGQLYVALFAASAIGALLLVLPPLLTLVTGAVLGAFPIQSTAGPVTWPNGLLLAGAVVSVLFMGVLAYATTALAAFSIDRLEVRRS